MSDLAGLDHARPAVLQIVPRLDRDEAGSSTVDIARHLRKSGWRAIVASAGGPLERELAMTGAVHATLPLDRAGPMGIWRNAGRLARLIHRHGIAVVHARAPAAAWSAARAARRTGTAFMTTVHEAYPVTGGRGHRFHRVMAAGARVIAVSEYIAEQLVEGFGVPPERIRVVRRWIDPDEFDPERVRGHRVAALAERWNLAAGTRLVMLPGSITRGRGHLLLLRAMAQMRQTDFSALFIGDLDPQGGYVKELLAFIRRSGLGDRVRFGGGTDDLPAALTLGDVAVFPATEPDPSGMLAAAAQAMGKPVIVTDRGALAESVMPAATGWLVPPDDPGELARALELALAMDEEVRLRLAARARTFVVGEFGLEPNCQRTLAVYRELLGPSAGSRPGNEDLATAASLTI